MMLKMTEIHDDDYPKHKFGSIDRNRQTFLRKATMWSMKENISTGLSHHLKYQLQNVISGAVRDGSVLPDDFDKSRTQSQMSSLPSNERYISLRSKQCLVCHLGQDAVTFTDSKQKPLQVQARLTPKPKTSTSVIQCLKKKRLNKGLPISKFQSNILSNYYSASNKLYFMCKGCGRSIGHLVCEKRASKNFVDRHSILYKQKRQKRKQSRSLTHQLAVNISQIESSDSNYIENSKISSVSSNVTDSSASSSVSAKTQSPMQAFKAEVSNTTHTPSRSSFSKVQPRCTDRNSATIIRKFQQQHIDKLIKSKLKNVTKGAKKVSALDSFLQSMK